MALSLIDRTQWLSDKLEEITTGFMRINRTLVDNQRSFAEAENPDHIRGFINSNMENKATQAKENWATTNRIDSLISKMELVKDRIQQMEEATCDDLGNLQESLENPWQHHSNSE